MSGAKYTPGPWEFCPDFDGIPGHRERARVEFGKHKWVNIGQHGNDFDARLIAASPDLFESLERFVTHYPNGINPMLDDAASAARAAIAKARGQS